MRIFGTLLLLLQWQILFSQAYITDVFISELQSGKGISGQSLKSTWAPLSESDENGYCRLSFILNPEDKFLPLDYTIETYAPASFTEIYLPVSHNPAIPYELHFISKELRNNDYKLIYKQLQNKLFQKHNTISEKLKPHTYLFCSQIITNQILELQYLNKYRPVQMALQQLKTSTLTSALLPLDTLKISAYLSDLNYEKKQLNVYAPDYEYQLTQIEQKEKHAKEALKLRNILLWIENKAIEDSSAIAFYNTVLSKSPEKSEQLLSTSTNENLHPLETIEQTMALAFSYIDENQPEKAMEILNQLKTSHFADDEILNDLPHKILLNFILKELKHELNTENEATTGTKTSLIQPKLVDTEWLFFIYADKNEYLKLTENLYFPTNFKILMETELIEEKLMNKLAQYQFNEAISILEINWTELMQMQVAAGWKTEYLVQNLSLQLIVHDLADKNAEFNRKLGVYQTQLSSTKNKDLQELTIYLKNYLSGNFAAMKTLKTEQNSELMQFLLSLAQKSPNQSIYLTENSGFIKNWSCLQEWKLYTFEQISPLTPNCPNFDFSAIGDCTKSTEETFWNENTWLKKYADEYKQKLVDCLIETENYPGALSLIEIEISHLQGDSIRLKAQSQKYLTAYQINQAKIYNALEQYELALETLQAVQKNIPSDLDKQKVAEYNYLMGLAEYQKHNFQAALEWFDKTTSEEKWLNSKDIYQIIELKSDIYLEQNNAQQAALAIQNGLKKRISETDKLLLEIKLSKIQTNQKMFSTALSQLQKVENNIKFTELSGHQQLNLHILKTDILARLSHYSQALNSSDSVLMVYESAFLPEELDAKADLHYLRAGIYQTKNQVAKSFQELNKSLENNRLAYEQLAGNYELKLARPYLKMAEIAYAEMQKQQTKEMHSIGQENAGLAVSILKKYPENQQAHKDLQRAVFLKNYFENIFW